MNLIDVFSDASQRGQQYAGAYIVGRAGKPFGLALDSARNSMEAELLASHAGIEAARNEHPGSELVLHSDLAELPRILFKGKTTAAVLLASNRHVEFRTDGNAFPEHRRCHHYARVIAGIYGTRHPLLVREKAKEKRWSEVYAETVLPQLALHPQGVSFVRLAQECGLGFNVLMKVIHDLTAQSKVSCQAACDLRQWIVLPKV